ncbi:hypothetical protein ACFFH5_17230 [Epilithonimonas hispanica]|uniref:Helix-turn-helix domain-containing protein n=1 Tax=Epilithonimonas hispanica TaxID=358687 RepID=A0A3D9CW68_9FLAO|nr:hypothetical protein DRF58_10900 [Epilithonimonas hispanica]
MEINFLNSQDFVRKLIEYLENMMNDAENFLKFLLDESQIMFLDDVCQMLRVSVRSMSNYRKKGLINGIQLNGNVIFIKPLLMLDLLKQYYVQNYGPYKG